MICPDCDQVLMPVDFRGIKIQECAHCQGRWFDRDELTKAKNMTDDDLRWLDFDPFGQDADQFHAPPERKQCPRCQKAMDALMYEGAGVVIDRCLDCRGIWVHHGEFEKIIQYLEDLVTSKSGAEYVRDTFAQFLQIAWGKEKLSLEIRDFLVVLKLSERRWGAEHPRVADAIKRIYEYLPFL
ncbi:MAG TPA: zf-TFIIB domain-containing protein [Candidatus Omnitrophota bacterium]|nr:zf-TFIIB domain-containing protein [Candidatus Omnitrophota bacterium]